MLISVGIGQWDRSERDQVKKKAKRDLERTYPQSQFIAKLRRLADSLEQGKPFDITIAAERIRIPSGAVYNIEHERSGDEEEIEFQIKWSKSK